jgi:hypothetical protein
MRGSRDWPSAEWRDKRKQATSGVGGTVVEPRLPAETCSVARHSFDSRPVSHSRPHAFEQPAARPGIMCVVIKCDGPGSVFAWRGEVVSGGEPPLITTITTARRDIARSKWRGLPVGCPYCGELLVCIRRSGPHYLDDVLACGFCGWGRGDASFEDEESEAEWTTYNILRAFDISSTELPLKDLRAFIATNPARANDLPPRRFEQLVADVFRNGGYSVELTQTSRDGGRDLLLLSQASLVDAIVEVKRHRRRVGVELVRQLRGVQLRDEVAQAMLVATSGFTAGARREADDPRPQLRGFELKLLDLDELMRTLDVLAEPVASPAAVARCRARYRSWLSDTFGPAGALTPDHSLPMPR